jgi:MFS family permease
MSENTESRSLYWNYVFFCCLYSAAHGSVDAVLAYSTSELGDEIGSNGSAGLYISYTVSAFFFAKPILKILGPRNSIFCGLCGMLLYVASFFLAIQTVDSANFVFTAGGLLGGLGAGLLWPSQGAYFATSAIKYAAVTQQERSCVVSLYASIFAGTYLGFEAAFKVIATIAFLTLKDDASWHVIVFGIYTFAAYCSVMAYGIFLPNVPGAEAFQSDSVKVGTVLGSSRGFAPGVHAFRKIPHPSLHHGELDDREVVPDHSIEVNLTDIVLDEHWITKWMYYIESLAATSDLLSVVRAIGRERLLQLIIPYQICFGFSAGFVGYYINSKVVAAHLGDGYIGLATALSTLCAALVSFPSDYISKLSSGRGKWYIMTFGALCFCSSGLAPLFLSDVELSRWGYVMIYFALHGIARGCWEGTNKAVIVEYFSVEDTRETAFAAIYFTSGLSGALGYYFYRYMTRSQMIWTNIVVPLVALISYHYSDKLFYRSLHARQPATANAAFVRGRYHASPMHPSSEDEQATSKESGNSAKFTIESFEIE